MTPSPVDQLVSINSQIVQYLEVLLAMAAVLALAFVVLKLGLPKLMGVKAAGGGPIQVLSRQALTPKNTLYLVKVGSQISLIAAWDNGVTFLTDIAQENVPSATRTTTVLSNVNLPWRPKGEKER
jgi:flagellar biogenesis protein FliO